MGNPFDWSRVVESLAGTPQPHFGNLERELGAARAGVIVSPLAHFGLLRFSGDDALDFLQGQLTCDLREVGPTAASFGGYCTPKGRLLADFLLWLTPQGYAMHLPHEVAGSLAERLRKFVLRAKVRVDPSADLRVIGIGGPEAAALLQQVIGEPPRTPLEIVHYPAAGLLRLPGDDFLAFASGAAIAPLWNALAASAVPAGSEAWNWTQVRAGIPWITAATQDQFIPQMVGLEIMGGVSFDKGCYAGQEIVARAHYLGEVKRKLGPGHADAAVAAGDALFDARQPVGVVLNAAASPAGGHDLLAVAQVALQDEVLHLGSSDGPPVRIGALSG